jgi:hypothetical protein
MPDIQLARREGVELVATGSWELLSGSWNPNRKDILAAVESAQCPAVRRPKIKIGHLDPRFNEPDDTTLDGTPSLGWFDNLRASNDGNTLVGDQVALPWLTQVQAAAWPDRSIEGKYNSRCGLGHIHPFVITAVSLLGETPPGIPTLKSITSLDDLPAALGVAAAGEAPEGGEDVQATIRAAAADPEPVHTGAIVALIPTEESAARLAIDGGEPASELHVTLAYLGEAADLGVTGRQDVLDAVTRAANGLPHLEADAFSAAIFNPGDAKPEADPCLVYLITGDAVDAVHDLVDEALLWDVGPIPSPIPPQIRPWVAHATAEYSGDVARLSELASRMGPVTFDRIRLAFAGEYTDIPLIPPDEQAENEAENGPVAASAAVRTRIEALRAARAEAPVAASEPPDLPAAEPEHEENPDPKEEDFMSTTDLSGFRSRLGLTDDADEQAILSALDDLKAKADTPAPAPEPTPEMVAASAAAVEQATKAEAEKDELRKEVQILASQMKSVSDELAATKAKEAATVKASVLDTAAAEGKFTPADREQWEKDYDEAPNAVTRVLASIAPGTAVPVSASGVTGPAEPLAADELDVSDGALNAWAQQLGINSEELTRG